MKFDLGYSYCCDEFLTTAGVSKQVTVATWDQERGEYYAAFEDLSNSQKVRDWCNILTI